MKEELEFKVEGKEWETLQTSAFNKLNKDAKIDGFRPGKASREMFEKKYGKNEILFEAADKAIKKEYTRILSEGKILPVIEPKVDLIACDDKKLEVKFVFVVEPEVKLGEYTNLKVKKEKAKVTKEEVEERINSLLDEYAELTVKTGKVENGDIAVIDFSGFKDGVAFEGGTAENYSLTIGSKSFIPGFEEAIIGMETGSEKDINLTFPEDYMAEDLRGKEVVFKVKVNEIKSRVVPKLDKDFFEDLAMEGVNSKEELEKEITKELKHHKEHELEHAYEDKCLEKASENMKIEIAEELIDDEVEHMYKEFMQRMSMQGITEELYYKYTNSTKEDITKQMRDDAEKRIKYRYLLKEIIKVEKLNVTEKEAQDRVKEMSEMYNVDEDTILKEVSIENIKFDLLYQKALDLVTANKEDKK